MLNCTSVSLLSLAFKFFLHNAASALFAYDRVKPHEFIWRKGHAHTTADNTKSIHLLILADMQILL